MNSFVMKSRLLLFAAVAVSMITFGNTLVAQTPEATPATKTVATPTITFELNWPEAEPNWFAISVEEGGAATYESRSKKGTDEADPLSVKFTVSEATRKRMFEMAKNLNYFQGEFEYRGGNIAKTGMKTLRYQSGAKTTETTFNFSTNTDLMDLVSMFQKISTTIEFGQRIEFKLRFDKLGLDSELKAMETSYNRGALLETQAIAPILQRVLNDRGTMNISRTRIQRVLGQNGGGK